MSTPQHSCEDGFTLVELLVSLALLSLMSIYVLNALGIIGKMREAETRIETALKQDAVLRLFSWEVGSLAPVFVQSESNAAHLYFAASSDELTYATMADGTREVGGLHGVSWKVNDRKQLVMERHLLRTPQGQPTNLILLDGVERVEFKFNEDQTSWQNDQSLPRTIKMTLIFSAAPQQPVEATAVIETSK